MLKRFFSVLILFFIFQSVIADTASNKLEKLLNNYQSYEANFTQVNYDNKNRPGKKSSGKVYMARPGKFRWETTSPYQQIVIANGDILWVYDVDLAQATQQSLNKRGFNPAQLLTAPVNDLTQNYTVSEETDGWFKLIPNNPGRGFKVAYLQFRNNQLTGLKVINQLNQTNMFNFSDIHLNPKLSESLFKLSSSKKIQILKG